MQRVLYKFGSVNRNFFPLGPIFADVDQLVIRPKTNQTHKVLKQHKTQYNHKLKSMFKRIQSKVQIDESKKEKEQKLELANLFIDPETGYPVGTIFDTFLMEKKKAQLQQVENEFEDKLKNLLKSMSMQNTGDLIFMGKLFLTKKSENEFLDKSRAILFENLRKKVEELKYDSVQRKKFLGEYFDSSQSQEFIQSQIVDGKEDVIKGLLNPEKVKETARLLSEQQLSDNIDRYRQLTEKYESQRHKSLEQKMNESLQFYESPVTQSDHSDDDRVVGFRYTKTSKGDETLLSEQQIKDRTNLNLIKRAFLKKERLRHEANEENYFNEEETLQQSEEFFKGLLQDHQVRANREAQSIGKSLGDEVTFEKVQNQLDFLLFNAPQNIKNALIDKEKNKNKRFQPDFLGEEKHISLLWEDFEATFENIFPNVTLDQNRAVMDSYHEEKRSEDQKQFAGKDEYSIQLYKELQQPKNLEFFSHYLRNEIRMTNQAITQGIMSQLTNEAPYMNQINQRNLYDDDDQDLDEVQQDQKDMDDIDKTVQNVKKQILNEFQEASLLKYLAVGKRKSARAYVTVKKGSGKVQINGKSIINYFSNQYDARVAIRPAEFSKLACYIDVEVLVRGGSVSGQAEAIMLGLGRALVKMCSSLKPLFRILRFTKSDLRLVERKKTGLYKARAKWPYSRR
ncbi:hypothetical protein pb186bvf_000092 [Paramecium bursaria]